jgi:drug/metabolite transporter (DMT)-like permease
VIMAFEYTSVTSGTIFNSATVPVSLCLLSYFFMSRVYGKMHYLGAAIAVCGLLLLIISDKENGPSEQESNPILGDFLALMAACRYSLSNIIQESFIDSGMSMSEIFSAFVVFMAASLRSPLSYSSIDLALQGFLNSLNQSIVFTSFPRMQCSR